VITADGIEEEFQLAIESKLFVIPVGCTGGKAAELHQRVLDSFPDYFPAPGYKRLFQALGKSGFPPRGCDKSDGNCRKAT
jgi:hypothetical protein